MTGRVALLSSGALMVASKQELEPAPTNAIVDDGAKSVDESLEALGVGPVLRMLERDPATLVAFEREHSLGLAARLHGGEAGATAADDYICGRSGSDAGVCLPPYVLFQLRVDGHPS